MKTKRLKLIKELIVKNVNSPTICCRTTIVV